MSSYRQLGFLLALSCCLLAGSLRWAQAQKLSTFYSFTGVGEDGASPRAGLMLGTDDNFYGTTYVGGAYFRGSIFKITPSGSLTTLYSFTGGADGANPFCAPLMQASDGNLYGTAYQGGANGVGTIFKVTPSGTFTTLHSFTGAADGAYPRAGLIQASNGNLYGACEQGGANGHGTIFKITPSGTFTVLHTFSAINSNGVNTDGIDPGAALVQANDGNLYGATAGGGANGNGTIFKITPSGAFTPLYSLNANTDSSGPSPLLQASDGNIYGTAYGAGGDGGAILKSRYRAPSPFSTGLVVQGTGTIPSL